MESKYEQVIGIGCTGEIWKTISDDALPSILDRVVEFESWYASRVGRAPLTNSAEIIAKLEDGNPLDFDNGGKIRKSLTRETPQFKQDPQAEKFDEDGFDVYE